MSESNSNTRSVVVGGVPLQVRDGTWDVRIADEVITHDCYRLRAWRPREQATVLDVGAHIGSFSAWIATRFPKASVYAFEMDESNQKLLALNTCAYAHVHRINAALGARSGSVVRGDIATENTGGAGVIWEAREGARVPALSAAEFIKNNDIGVIDLLKLDCEGSEFDIIESLASLPGGLKGRIARVCAEVHARLDDPRASAMMRTLSNTYSKVETNWDKRSALCLVFAQ